MFIELFFGFMFFVGVVSFIEHRPRETVYIVVDGKQKTKYIHRNVKRERLINELDKD